nr:NADH dehydrogenase subunit 4 [Sida crystallina]
MLKIIFISTSILFLHLPWVTVILILSLLSFLALNTLPSFNLITVNFFILDSLSFLMVILSLWLTLLMIGASFYIKEGEKKYDLFLMLILSMNFFLILSFSTSNLLQFYILFESTLIPIFLIVMGWGYQPERVKASYYLLFYTLFASLPLLLSLLFLFNNLKTLDFNLLNFLFFSSSGTLFWGLSLAFLVKLPVYFGHLWLPKAHVEAPVAGSMILAGVLLKLGGYGLLRTVMVVLTSASFFSNTILSLGLVGSVLAGFICLRQTDMKALIAYSSVAHMGLVIAGIFFMTYTSWVGVLMILVAHGLCSSGLFCIVGSTYNRLGSRSMLILRGSISSTPLFSLWWFLFSAANMAAPPTPNLGGEILIFMSSLSLSGIAAVMVGISSFLAGAYNLYLFSSTQHGNKLVTTNSYSETTTQEHLIFTLHFLPLLLSLLLLFNLY